MFFPQHNFDFNNHVIINVIYIENKPILDLVNKITRFYCKRWVGNMLVQYVWDWLSLYKIDTYCIVFNLFIPFTDKQFMAKQFK